MLDVCQLATNTSSHSIRSLFVKLCLAHSSCTLAAVIEVPPFAKGSM